MRYKDRYPKVVIILLLFYIFTSGMLLTSTVVLLPLVLLLFLCDSKSFLISLDKRSFWYIGIIVYICVNFVFALHKNLLFFSGTITSLLIGYYLCKQIDYKFLNRGIIFFSTIQLFIGLFSWLWFGGFILTIGGLLPNDLRNAIIQFHSDGRIVGMNSQSGVFAIYLTLFIASFFMKFLVRRNWRYLLSICIAFLLILASSRRGSFAINILCIYVVWCLYRRISLLNLKTILFIIVSLVFLFSFDLGVMERFSTENLSLSDTKSVDEFTSGRITLYMMAFTDFLSYPILGTGFKFFFDTYEIDVHNTYIQILCEGGIAGCIILFTFFVYNLIITIRASFSVKEISLYFSMYIQLFYVCMCLIENPFSDRYFFLTYLIAVSLAYKCIYVDKKNMSYV